MKKLFVLLVGVVMMLFAQQSYSQSSIRLTENFSVVPPAGWAASNAYWGADAVNYLTGTQSYRGRVPLQTGAVTMLETQPYSFVGYPFVMLRFNHICKISPSDTVWVEVGYHQGAGVYGGWTPLPASTYKGSASNYGSRGFNAASYVIWDAANNTAMPQSSWWKAEEFELKNEAGQQNVKFRFVIKHGSVAGTNVAHGWLIDEFEILASTNPIIPPTVEFVSPFVRDTVYSTGPWEINAKVKSNTSVPIAVPWLMWSTDNGKTYDSIQMTKVDTVLWKAEIPQFPAGTNVVYRITGKDITPNTFNTATISSKYYIKMSCGSSGWAYKEYFYMGNPEQLLLQPGIYEIEVWGANGGIGSNGGSTGAGGKGGYSKGTVTLPSATNVYIVVGGVGANWVSQQNSAGGYNGGGLGTAGSNGAGGGGGGATHISKVSGLLSNSGVHSSVIVVAGGGGGGNWDNAAGDGGGTNGGANSLANSGQGGTQIAGGIGGQGATPYGLNGTAGQGGDGSSSGANSGWSGGGGGGSGYINGLANAITAQTAQSGFVSNPVTTGNGYAKITFIASLSNCDTSSAALHSISIKDTTPTSLTYFTPITVTIKNKGVGDLDSVKVSYTINGLNQKDSTIKFVPPISWDMSKQVTIGTYNFTPNSTDTLKVWVSYPNGKLDNESSDDTITKKSYGTKDITVQ